MKAENENIEPVTDLRLALGYSNHSIQRRLSNDLGAGANAASKIDMTFVTTDPLSELVWSPHKGPSLKCTDCSFADNQLSLLWGAGPSCVVVSPQEMNTSAKSSNDKPIDEHNLNKSISTSNDQNIKVTNRDNSEKSAMNDDDIGLCQGKQTDNDNSFQGNAGFLKEINRKGGESDQDLVEKNNLVDSKEANVFCPNNSQEAEIAEAMEESFPDEREPHLARVESLFDPAAEARDIGSGYHMPRMEMDLTSGVQLDNKCETSEHPEKSLTSPGRIPEISPSLMDKKGKSKMGGVSSIWPIEKLEATAENFLQTRVGDNECVATSKISGSESSSEVEENFQQHKEILSEKTSTDKHSPTNSRIRSYKSKGKEKALSDGEVKKMMSKEDDSHESVESCNSAGLFSRGKKRWGFEHQLIVGSKRMKKQMNDSPCSSSFVKQDSSFMNWISNMMKGFFKSKDETPSLALTFPNPNQSRESSEKIVDINNKNKDLQCKNTGFQSIFQSLYSPKTKVQGTATQNENYQTGLELSDKVYDINATPIAYHGENFNLHKVFLLSNQRFKEPVLGSQEGQPSQLKVSSMNLSPSKRSSEGNSAENKNSCNLAVGLEKNGASSSSSLGKLKEINTENIDSDAPSEGKTVHNIDHKSNYLGSLWITRFTPKSSNTLLKPDNGGAVEHFNANVSSNLKIVEARQQSSEEPVTSSGRELPNSATEIETSIGFNKFAVQNEQKLKCKVSPILPSPKLKDSEVMASLFARRLDALKHIIPSRVSDNTTSSTVTCFFCGRKGHHMQCCPEIRDNEIGYLQRNMKSSDKLEDLSCVCLRCFEPNHWAAACPKLSADRSSSANLSGLQYYTRFEETKKQFDENRRAITADTGCMGIDTAKGPSSNYGVTADKIRSKDHVDKKYIASSSKENKLKENQITARCNFINLQASNMPKAIFNAVRILRLSRTDILKWMSSKTSHSQLEGFFLRLRLGKWEEGLGGTGYYVACITGAHRQNTEQNSKNSISVNVGRINCLVESQCISNHDFLEDELTTWWRATTKSGGQIPSQEELTMKVKERRLLGL